MLLMLTSSVSLIVVNVLTQKLSRVSILHNISHACYKKLLKVFSSIVNTWRLNGQNEWINYRGISFEGYFHHEHNKLPLWKQPIKEWKCCCLLLLVSLIVVSVQHQNLVHKQENNLY